MDSNPVFQILKNTNFSKAPSASFRRKEGLFMEDATLVLQRGSFDVASGIISFQPIKAVTRFNALRDTCLHKTKN
jgi:hypothetical protein